MTKQKQEQAAAPSPSPALFSLHPTLFFMFSSLDSNFQFAVAHAPANRQPATTNVDDEPSHSQGDDRRLPAMDHARKRHQEKGFLYDCSVCVFDLNFSSVLYGCDCRNGVSCFFPSFGCCSFFMLCCCFFCHEACEHCLKCFCCCRNMDE